MREILTVIAACVVAMLTAALVAPPFVDWAYFRAPLERMIGAAVGGNVRLDGRLDVRLLPAPSLSANAITITRSGLSLQAGETRFEIAPGPLLRGRMHFTEIVLQQPILTLDPDGLAQVDGRTDILEKQETGGAFALARLVAKDATLRLSFALTAGDDQSLRAKSDNDSREIQHVDFSASAESFAGPFRGEGSWRSANGPVDIAFSTGAYGDGALRVKLGLSQSSGEQNQRNEAYLERLDVDGALSSSGGGLSFNGGGVGSGVTKGLAWRIAFSGKGGLDKSGLGKADLDVSEVRLGDEAQGLSAKGLVHYHDDGRLDIDLAARRLDFDRFGKAAVLTDFMQAAARFGDAAPYALALRAESLLLGGQLLGAPSFTLEHKAGEINSHGSLTVNLPGRSHLSYNGALNVAVQQFDGLGALTVGDGPLLAHWLTPIAPGLAAVVEAAGASGLDLAGAVKSRDGVTSIHDLKGRAGRSAFMGDIVWRSGQGVGDKAERAFLSARIVSPALDIENMPDGLSLARSAGDIDFDVSLEAQAARIARAGASATQTGAVHAHVSRRLDEITVHELTLANLGGADLRGAGRFNKNGGRIDLKLDAEKLDDFATLARNIAPGSATQAFLARAAVLSPAHLALSLETMGSGEIFRANLTGAVGKTSVAGVLSRPAQGPQELDLTLTLDAPEAAPLLRQAGLPVLPLQELGRAHFEARARGAPDRQLRAQAQFSAAGTLAEFTGALQFSTGIEGRIRVSSENISSALQVFSGASPGGALRVSARAEAGLSLNASGLSLTDISGDFKGDHFTGRLSHDFAGATSGAFSFARLSAPALAALVVGAPQPAPEGALWSDLTFAPSAIDLPTAFLDIAVDRIDFGGLSGAKARFRLGVSSAALSVEGLSMAVAGGALSGSGHLARNGADVMAKGRITFDNLALRSGPLAAGLSGAFEASGSGRSPAAFMRSLSGFGGARFNDIRFLRTDAAALAATLKSFDVEDKQTDGSLQNNFDAQNFLRLFERNLDRQTQTIDGLQTEATLAAGRLVFAPVAASISHVSIAVSGVLDLQRQIILVRETFAIPKPADWEGEAPSASVIWAGPWAAPARNVEANGLIADLSAKMVARETVRNQALESDIHERAFFNRRMKFDRGLHEERRAAILAQRAARARAREKEAARALQLQQRAKQLRSYPSEILMAPHEVDEAEPD